MTEERTCCVDGCDTPNKKVLELNGNNPLTSTSFHAILPTS